MPGPKPQIAYQGRWVQRGMIRVPVTPDDTDDFDTEPFKEAHRRFAAGHRDTQTIADNREYHRRNKAKSRARTPLERLWDNSKPEQRRIIAQMMEGLN